jgi:simple sugar transport system permease protein
MFGIFSTPWTTLGTYLEHLSRLWIGLAAGALLFGYTDALQLRRGSESVHALLLLVAILLVAVAAWQASRKAYVSAGIAVVVGVFALFWFFATKEIPVEFVQVAPHILTLVVLALASQRLRPPAADGIPYRKGSG